MIVAVPAPEVAVVNTWHQHTPYNNVFRDRDTFTCGHCHNRVPDIIMDIHIPMCRKGHSPEEIAKADDERARKLHFDLTDLRSRLQVDALERVSFTITADIPCGSDLINAIQRVADTMPRFFSNITIHLEEQ